MNYTIRYALPQDATTLVQLHQLHAAYEHAEYNPEGKVQAILDHYFTPNPPIRCIVAVVHDVVIGYATFTKDFATWAGAYFIHMDCLYLQEAYRGHSIGEALVNNIATYAVQHNIAYMEWQTPSFNAGAIKFYYRLGATSKHKLRMYLTGQALHARVM